MGATEARQGSPLSARAARWFPGCLAEVLGLLGLLGLMAVGAMQSAKALPPGAVGQIGGTGLPQKVKFDPNEPSRLWVITSEGVEQRSVPGLELLSFHPVPHGASVYFFGAVVDLSLDGSLLASGSYDTTVRLWDVATGQLTTTLQGHSGSVIALAFSPDGNLLASGSDDGTVRLWDVATGQLITTLQGHSGSVLALAFSPDGNLLASGGYDTTARLWDVATGQLTTTLQGHSSFVSALAFSPDGNLLASGSEDGTVRLWDVANLLPVATLQGHSNILTSLAFSPDGSLLASGSFQEARLWDTSTHQLLATLQGHSDWVISLAFSPDGSFLASAEADQTVRLWDVTTAQETGRILYPSPSWISSVTFSPDGGTLSVTSGSQGLFFNASTLQLSGALSFGNARAVAYSPDGTRLAVADGTSARLVDPATGQESASFTDIGDLYSVAFRPDGNLLAVGGSGLVRLWNVNTGLQEKLFIEPTGPVTSVAFSLDGNLLAAADGGPAWLWDVVSGGLLLSLGTAASAVAFNPPGNILAVGENGTVTLWDPTTGQQIGALSGLPGTAKSVAFSPDGGLLAVGAGNEVSLWDVASGQQIVVFQGHRSPVNAVAFNPDGTRLASGGDDGAVFLWDSGSYLPAVTNQPPTLTSPGDQTIAEGSSLTFQLAATDPEGAALSFAATGLPQGAALDPTTGIFLWTPDYDQAGTYPITFTVVDRYGATDSQTITITVTNTNRPPTVEAVPDKFVVVGTPLTFTLSGSDPDGEPITFSATGLPQGATLDPATGVFSWTPSPGQGGVYAPAFTATDPGGATSPSVAATITVRETNGVPTLNTLAPQSVAETQTLTFTLTGSDPEGDPLTFSATGLSQGATLDPATGAFSWTPNYDQAGTYSVSFTATDPFGGTSSPLVVSITVTNTNRPPVLDSPGDQTVAAAHTLGFTLTGSDPDGESLTFSATGLPQGATLDPSTGAFSWTPTFDQIGTYSVSFTATDPNGAVSTPVTLTITVVSGNHPPVITASVLDADPSTPGVQDPFPVAAGGTRLIPLSASDVENDPLTFAVTTATTALGATVELVNNILVYRAPAAPNPLNSPAVDTATFSVSDPFDTVSGSVLFEVIPFRSLSVRLSYEDRLVQIGFGGDDRLDALADLLAPPDPGTSSFGLRITETRSPAGVDGTDYYRNIVLIPSTPAAQGPTVVWQLTVRTGTVDPNRGVPNELRWDPIAPLLSDVEASTGVRHYALLTNPAIGERWNMATRTALPLGENATYTFEIQLYPRVVQSLTIPYRPGWNLISLPGEVLGTGLDAINSSAISAYAWDPSAGNWVSVPLPLSPTSLDPVSRALFVKADSTATDATLDVDVDNPLWRDVPVTLQPGWNLIGAPWAAPNELPVSVVSGGLGNQTLMGWDGAAQRYAPVTDFLSPGSGYWVYNDTGSPLTVRLAQWRDLVWNGTVPQVLIHATPRKSPQLRWRIPLTLETWRGQTQWVELATALGAHTGLDALDIPLPPSPPTENSAELYVATEDAVGRLMRSVVPGESAEWEIVARLSAPGMLRWEVPRHWEGIQLLLRTEGRVIDMVRESSLALGAGVHRLGVTFRRLRPTETGLLPAYPNPFNPSVWIPFRLSRPSSVEITIYDGSGSVVRELSLGELSEGYYTRPGNAAYWNGRNALGEPVASGVYFIRFRAGSVVQTRRVVVRK